MNILPYPQKLVKIAGSFSLETGSKVYAANEVQGEVSKFLELIKISCGSLDIQLTSDISEAKVIFQLNDCCAEEGYHIMISQGTATVSFSTQKGCFYAIKTLCQLFGLSSEQESISCCNCYIEDEPKYAYRGLMLDVCRHFFPIETVKTVIDLMSQAKLNKLHLHLSDDQGFRLQIDKYPKLNEVSSNRLGSEVLVNGERYVDETPHGGYYTKQQIAELVKYADEHFVEIIPEIDLPGHFVAILAAYPEYSCMQTELEVRKKWGISKDILCAGNEKSFEFVCGILNEVAEMFPSKYLHLGGDEAPKDRWCNCKLCREKLAELKLDNFDDLQAYLVNQFAQYLEQKGKTVICWNDGIAKSSSAEIISQCWKPFTRKQSVKQANLGRKTIMSPFFSMYFDYPYAMTPLRKTRKFNPSKGVRRKNTSNILGVEGTVWTEYIADTHKLFFNLLPRLDALAECAWGSKTKGFKARVLNKLYYYDKLKLNNNKYAIKSGRRPGIVKKFFKQDPNIELNQSKKD